MNIEELVQKNRSYRRFHQSPRPTREELLSLVDRARCSASAANLQRLRFVITCDPCDCDRIFKTLAFAGYLKDWAGPREEERPTAYITVMTEKSPDVNVGIDMGIAAEAMLLSAVDIGYGGCMFRSIKREELSAILGKEGYSPELVIALGAPSEEVYLTEARNGDIKYYRDELDRHAVPKLSLDELIL